MDNLYSHFSMVIYRFALNQIKVGLIKYNEYTNQKSRKNVLEILPRYINLFLEM